MGVQTFAQLQGTISLLSPLYSFLHTLNDNDGNSDNEQQL